MKTQKNATPVEPVTRSGWYALTDGRVQHFHWAGTGSLVGGSIVARWSEVPDNRGPLNEGDYDQAAVGMGATGGCWTDRHPYTVVAVSASGKTITLQRDEARRTDKNGMSESQSYLFIPNPYGDMIKASLRKNGQWVEVGKQLGTGYRFQLGVRSKYHDYSF